MDITELRKSIKQSLSELSTQKSKDENNLSLDKIIEVCTLAKNFDLMCGKRKKYNISGNRKEYVIEKVKSSLRARFGGMISRCYKKEKHNFKDYGGRGISICEEWRNDFNNFYNWAINNGFEQHLQIDRIDNDGNYSPENCRWVTKEQNSINTRLSSANKSGFKGVVFHKEKNKWKSQIIWNRQYYFLGYYIDIEDAKQAVKRFVTENNTGHLLNY